MSATMETNASGRYTLPKVSAGGGGDWQLPEEGEHRMCVDEIKGVRVHSYLGKPSVDENGEATKYDVRLQFRILGGDDQGLTILQWFTYSINEKAKLRPILDAIAAGMGDDAPPLDEESFDLNDWLNQPFRGIVKHRPWKDTVFANVTEALPIKRKEAKPARPVARPPANEDDDPFPEDEDE